MPFNEEGHWIPDLSPKGYAILNDNRRYILTHGPRRTGKTITYAHKLCNHIYKLPIPTRVAIVTRTTRAAKAGVWDDITKAVLPKWQNEGGVLPYTKEPSNAADTKINYFKVLSGHGAEITVELHSLDYAKDAEERFKNTRFSFVWLVEADNFDDRIAFDTLSEQLRVIGLPYEDHQLIADCNPPQEGEAHWLRSVWWKDIAPDGIKGGNPEYVKLFANYQMLLEDNLWLSEEEKTEVKMKWAHDPITKARYVDGIWVSTNEGSAFEDVLSEELHHLGEMVPGKPRTEWNILVPQEKTFEMFTGWDTGNVNKAFIIGAKRLDMGMQCYDIIDEVAYVDSEVSTEDFVSDVIEKMDFWEEVMDANRIRWRHWSDSSAFRYTAMVDLSESEFIRKVSKGRINLISAPKPPGSVEKRVDLLRRLLFENRIAISILCETTWHSLQRMKNPKRGKGPRGQDPHRHCFDALTYALANEEPHEMRISNEARTRSSVNSIPL